MTKQRKPRAVYEIEAEVWRYSSEGAWYFITLPEEIAAEIKVVFAADHKGGGSLPVVVCTGSPEWSTSIFRDSKSSSYVLPLKNGCPQKGSARMTSENAHIGSSFDAFLRDEGMHEEVTSLAIARVLARQIEQQMHEQGITKSQMARSMGTSRSQLDRLLNPASGGVTLETMFRAARAVNRELRLELVSFAR